MRRVVAVAGIATLTISAIIGGHLAVRAQTAQPVRSETAPVSARPIGPAQSFAPSCSVVLRLTPETFTLVFVAQMQDDSEAGNDAAAAFWARCRQQATATATAGDPSLAARISRLRSLLGAMQSSESGLASLRAGGGTMFFHTLYRAAPAREQRLADVVALVRNGLATPASGYGMIINPLLNSVADRLARVQHPTRADLQFTTRAKWDEAATAYVRAVRAVESAAGSGNDAIRATILDVANQPLFLDSGLGG